MVVAKSIDSPRTVLEGHSRSMAYLLARKPVHDIPAIVGISENITQWKYF